MCHYYHICTDENNELLGNGGRSFYNTKSNVKVETNTISVAPNPANTYTTFSYQLPMLKEKATLVICDVTGKEIEKIVLTNSEGQQIWDTRNINNGLYYYYVTDGITKIAKGKIAVQK